MAGSESYGPHSELCFQSSESQLVDDGTNAMSNHVTHHINPDGGGREVSILKRLTA
jgi:hypothetical protein